MSFAKAYLGLRGAGVRALVIAACGVTLAGCDTLSSLNPFDKSETYKPEIVSDVPGETLYNDGLARIQKKDFEGAAKKFSTLEKQNPYTEWSRKALIMEAYANYEGGLYEEFHHCGEAVPSTASQHARCGLCPIPDGIVILRSDPGHHPRSGEVGAGDLGSAGIGAALSEF